MYVRCVHMYMYTNVSIWIKYICAIRTICSQCNLFIKSPLFAIKLESFHLITINNNLTSINKTNSLTCVSALNLRSLANNLTLSVLLSLSDFCLGGKKLKKEFHDYRCSDISILN